MIIYNITIKIDWSIAEDWLKWMQSEHINEVLNTGCFDKHLLVRLLEVDEADGPTYAIQYFTGELKKYDEYLQLHAPVLRKKVATKWGDRYIDFKTLMQIVE